MATIPITKVWKKSNPPKPPAKTEPVKGATPVKDAPVKDAPDDASKPIVKESPYPDSFGLQDNEDGTYTLSGLNATGDHKELGKAALISVAADDPAVLLVTLGKDMSFAANGLKAGKVIVTLITGWTEPDGKDDKGKDKTKIVPFDSSVPAEVLVSPSTGTSVKFG